MHFLGLGLVLYAVYHTVFTRNIVFTIVPLTMAVLLPIVNPMFLVVMYFVAFACANMPARIEIIEINDDYQPDESEEKQNK